MITPVTQAGTPINKLLFDSIQADLNTRMLKTDIATQSQAENGQDNTKFMTALRTLQSINANAKPSLQMSIKTGTISHNGTIPQTAGYANYMYIVSINYETLEYHITDYNTIQMSFYCSVAQNTRKVTCYWRGRGSESQYQSYNGTANYWEIAWN